MMTTTKTFKVALVNDRTNGARCGYGTGRTYAAAQQDALRLALQRDPTAYLGRFDGQAHFDGGVNC